MTLERALEMLNEILVEAVLSDEAAGLIGRAMTEIEHDMAAEGEAE